MYNDANKEFYSELEKILKTARLNYLNCNNYHVMGFELLSIKCRFYYQILKFNGYQYLSILEEFK